MAFWIGLYPKPFFQILEQPVNHTMAMARPDYPQPAVPVNAELGAPLLPRVGSSGNAAMQSETIAPASAPASVTSTMKGNN
jgi:hypothetical protein